MHSSPIGNCVLIVRCQAAYSPASRSVAVHCILETPGSAGQQRSFSDVYALLAAIQTDLLKLQSNLALAGQDNGQ